MSGDSYSVEHEGDSCFGVPNWCRHLPLLHRALRDTVAWPPRPGVDAEIYDHCAYWEPLYYLLRHLLGWQDLGRGLVWWYTRPHPRPDGVGIGLIETFWDQYIESFIAWSLAGSGGYEPVEGETVSARRSWLEPGFWEDVEATQHIGTLPWPGGGNALHLGHSDWSVRVEHYEGSGELFIDVSRRSARLTLSHFTGWLGELERLGETLPPLGDRSWHVEVHAGQIGLLGTFRRSRVTGRWFIGKHSVHLAGHPGWEGEPFRCTICRSFRPASSRYPRALCSACVSLASDATGRKVRFVNLGMTGGLAGSYQDDERDYRSAECWVSGVRCLASEHRLGGIVIQRAD